jgi:predicted dinucleotide-binding enzyme
MVQLDTWHEDDTTGTRHEDTASSIVQSVLPVAMVVSADTNNDDATTE